MVDRKPIVENLGETEALQPADRLDTVFTNDRLPQKTGILKGWVPAIDTGVTVDISAGSGFIVDNATDPALPVVTPLVVGPFNAQPVLNVATEPFTHFYIDSGGLLQQQNTPPTRTEQRTKIFIAVSYQPSGTVIEVYPIGQPAFEGDLFAQDMFRGTYVVEGNIYGPAVAGLPDPLELRVSAGAIGYSNANRQDTAAARRDPHFVAQSAEDPASWIYTINDGADGITILSVGATLVDTANKSDGAGALTPISQNRRGISVIYRTTTGETALEYTTADFNPNNTTASEAFQQAIIDSPLVTTFPFIPLYILEYAKDEADIDVAVFHRVDNLTINTSSGSSVDFLAREQASDDHATGVFLAGAMLVNGGNPAGFDIPDGQGWVSDSHSGNSSISTRVTWSGLTNLTPPDIGTQRSTFLSLSFPVDPNTAVVNYAAVDFALAQRRDLVVLGRVLHTDMATITGFINVVCPSYDVLLQVSDFLSSFGPFNVTGNVYSTTGANLIPHKTVGQSFKLGANYTVSRKSPNLTTDPEDGPGVTGLSFGYIYRDPLAADGFNIIIPQTAYNPNIYDDGTGATPSVPNNDWTFQTLYFFPQENTHRFHLGQATYQFKQDAIDAITGEPITADPFLNTAVRRGWLVIQEGTTDASDTANAVFLEASDLAFGSGGGGGGATTYLQLTDTDSVYTGKAGQSPIVNTAEDALVFQYPGVPADIAATKTTSTNTVSTTPVKLIYNTFEIKGDTSLFSYSSITGTITADKPIRFSIWAEYAMVVAFGSINPVARIAIYVNGSPAKTNDTDGYTTTAKEPWLGIEHVVSLDTNDTVEVYAQTLSETIDIFSTQNFMRGKVWRQE